MSEHPKGRTKVGIYIDAGLWKQVRQQALDTGISASRIIERALEGRLIQPVAQSPIYKEKTLAQTERILIRDEYSQE